MIYKKVSLLAMAAGILFLPESSNRVSAQGNEIEKIDKNFRTEKIGNTLVDFRNAMNAPFEITGFPWLKENGGFRRIPKSMDNTQVNKGVIALAKNTSGGAIRFASNSRYIAIRAKLGGADMNHMTRAGSAGLDLFSENEHIKTFQPSPQECRGKKNYESIVQVGRKMREYTLWLPLYGGVRSIEIGVEPNSELAAPRAQKYTRPIVFYGSSITQGACASRPANNYTTMLCREIDAPQVNLGFSGSAKGEEAMARAIAQIDAEVFVMDYDYNAPNAEHLLNTHEKFFKIVREARPQLPIIILTRCSQRSDKRRDIIKQTYLNAVANGDKKVWFIDGAEFFADIDNYATADNCHPNDLGFYRMFKRILPVLKTAIGR